MNRSAEFNVNYLQCHHFDYYCHCHHLQRQHCKLLSLSREARMFCSQPQTFLCKTLIKSQHVLPVAFFLLLFCYLPISVASDEETSSWLWEPDKYPNLSKEPKFCTGPIRNPPTSICDPDGTLKKEEGNNNNEK